MQKLMTAPIQEKRQDPRLINLPPFEVKLFKESKEEVHVFKAVNLSCSGISLVISHSFPIESKVSLRIKLPAPYSSSIKCDGHIRRCDEETNRTDHVRQFLCGLSLDASPEIKQELNRFITETVNKGTSFIDRRSPSRLRNGLVFVNPVKYRTFFLGQESPEIQIFQLGLKDLDELEKVEIEAWGKEMCATRAMLKSRLEVFSEGMIGARKDGKLQGYVGVMMIKSSLCDKDFTWMGITDGGYIRATHDPEGDCLYGVSLSVIPTASNDVAVKLLKAAEKMSVRKALKGVLLGCRIPNYHKHAHAMSVEKYIDATTRKGRVLDPELALYKQVNGMALRPISNYFEDPESLNYGVLIFWENPLYAIQRREFPFFFKSITVSFT